MSSARAIELILHRALVQDYTREVYLVNYQFEMDFEVAVVVKFPRGPPPPPPPPTPPSCPRPLLLRSRGWHLLGYFWVDLILGELFLVY